MKRSIAIALCVLAAGQASAADTLLLTGTEWSPLGSYTYAGAIQPLGRGSFGQGWVMRHWVDRLTYNYDGAQPDIHAESFGYSPALGFQRAFGSTHAGLYGATRIAHTRLTPDDRGNSDRGTQVRFSIQADAYTPLGDLAENQLIAQAEIGNGGYYVRDQLLFKLLGSYKLGPEIAIKGSEEYKAWQAGAALGGLRLGERVNLLLRGGINQQQGQTREGYVSVELNLNL